MDKIQKVLVEAGRKDLAKEYYLKVSGGRDSEKFYQVLEKQNKNVGSILQELKRLKAPNTLDKRDLDDVIKYMTNVEKKLEGLYKEV